MVSATTLRDKAAEAVRLLEEEQSLIVGHYLTVQTYGIALAKAGLEDPIIGIDPVTMSLTRELARLYPNLSSIERTMLRIEVARYFREENWADRYFERL